MNWGNIKYFLENQERIRHVFSDPFQSQLEAARRIEEQVEPIGARVRESTLLNTLANEQEFFHGFKGTRKLLADWETNRGTVHVSV